MKVLDKVFKILLLVSMLSIVIILSIMIYTRMHGVIDSRLFIYLFVSSAMLFVCVCGILLKEIKWPSLAEIWNTYWNS